MLQNAYLLAKIGADTAENERNFAEILPQIGNYPTGPLRQSVTGTATPTVHGGRHFQNPTLWLGFASFSYSSSSTCYSDTAHHNLQVRSISKYMTRKEMSADGR